MCNSMHLLAQQCVIAHVSTRVHTQPPPPSCREAREQLAKSATAADYKAYEREQEIRRVMQGEVEQYKRRKEVRACALVVW